MGTSSLATPSMDSPLLPTEQPLPGTGVSGASAEPRPGATTHSWFAVIWVIYLIDYADRFAISAVLPAIQEEFGLSDAHLGLMSGSLFLGLAVLAVPCGLAVDRFSRKYMITLMTLVWSLATWSTGMAKSFGALVASRILVGAGEAGYNPAGYALIAAWYPQRLRGTMVGLFNMAQPLGVGLGMMLAGHLAAEHGWRAVFGVLALPGVVLALAMLFAPDYKTTRREEPAVPKDRGTAPVRPGLADTLRYIASNRTLQLIYLAQLPIAIYINSMAIWGPTILVRQYQLSLAEAASVVGIITMVAGVGALVGGWFSDRVARTRLRARITVCLLYLAVPLVLHSVANFVALSGLYLVLFITVFSVGQFFAAANWGTLVAASLDQSPPPYRAACQSFLPMFQAIAALCAGVISGLLSQSLGLVMAMEVILVVGMVSALLLLNVARKRFDTDYRLQEALNDYRVELD